MPMIHFDNKNVRVPTDSSNQPSIVIKEVLGRGRGLFAQGRDFNEPGETILWIKQPLIVLLETSQLQRRCYQCIREYADENISPSFKDACSKSSLKACLGCQTVRYCSKKCQSRSWKEAHKYECKIFAALQPRVLPTIARAVIRLLKLHEGGLIGEAWTDLLSLESHQDDLSAAGGEQWQDLFLIAKAIKKYYGSKEPLDSILRICSILTVNSFTLTDPVLEPIGLVLDPLAAMLNHSCDPNCTIRFDADHTGLKDQQQGTTDPVIRSICIDLLRPVAKGEELTISYIDNTFPLAQRQHDLSSRYYFTCDCSRCLQGTNTPFDMLLQPSLTNIPLEAKADAINVLSKASSQKNLLPSMLPKIKYAFRLLAKASAFPIHRYPSAPFRQLLILGMISSGAWYEAMVQSSIIVHRIDPVIYPQEHHPVRVVNLWRLNRLAWQINAQLADGESISGMDSSKEEFVKSTVVATMMTLHRLRSKASTEMPGSQLHTMIAGAWSELVQACEAAGQSAFKGAYVRYKADPQMMKEKLREEWNAIIDAQLKEEQNA